MGLASTAAAIIWTNSGASGTRKYIVDIVADLPVIFMELNTSGTLMISYIYENSRILAQHAGDHTADRYFYLHDRLGSVRLLIDTSANVKNRYIYRPFGELHTDTADYEQTITNPFKFTGQYFDADIDQYYLRARHYDPHLARFTSRDPLLGKYQDPLSLHSYLYCQNEPINRLDRLGLWYEYHDTEDTQRIIAEATVLVGTDFILGPLLAFGYPGYEGQYDFFGTRDTFQLGKVFMQDTHFGNYLAGYTTYFNYGFAGELGVRGAGHGFALWQHHQLDEPASRYFISAGILRAQEDRQHAGVSLEPAGKWAFVRAKYELFYGYEWMIEELLNTGMTGSPRFDQLLTNWTEFWNSGPVIY
ncbi:MAG: RHS repeat-associated core domain-containing protein [Planctomycetota bacterium]|jgi:RHS repeat-associated protein